MKHYFWKASFIPKIPIPHSESDDDKRFQGDFFIISTIKYQLTDFRIKKHEEDSNRIIHFSLPTEVFLNESQIENLKAFYHKINRVFYSKFNSFSFDELKLILIPLIKSFSKELSDIDTTLQYIDDTKTSFVISDIYHEITSKFNKAQNGKELHTFFLQNGDFVDKFTRFIASIKCPIQEYINSTKEVNQRALTKKELVGLFAALKLQERIIDRIVWSELHNNYSQSGRMYYKYFYGNLFAFNLHPTMNFGDKQISHIEFYKSKNSFEGIAEDLPMLEVFYLNNIDLTPNIEKNPYPQAFSNAHQRILETIENFKLFIPKIVKRIPDDFEISYPNRKVPLEIMHIGYFPRFACYFAHYFNQLVDLLKPSETGYMISDDLVNQASLMIQQKLNYKFKDLNLLRSALIDPSYPSLHFQCAFSYQRLEYLGDCVLDITTNFAIFNANERANEGCMTILKHAMVSNKIFALLTLALGLQKYVITLSHSRYTAEAKCTADIFESLFGAIFLDSDLYTCFQIYQDVVKLNVNIFMNIVRHLKYGESTIRYIINEDKKNFCKIFISPPKTNFDLDLVKKFQNLFQNINELNNNKDYHFDEIQFNEKYLPYYQLAMTHLSAGKEYSYDRLEFIGDIVVKFAIGVALYIGFPHSDEAGLTISSSNYKSNDVLGRVSLKLSFGDYIIADDDIKRNIDVPKDMIDNPTLSISKIHGDLFESFTAALTISDGLVKSCQFVQHFVLGNQISNRPDNPQIDPTSLINIQFAKNLKKAPLVQTWEYQNSFYSYLSIEGIQFPFIGESSERAKSIQNLSRLLIDEINHNPKFFSDIELQIQDQNKDRADFTPKFDAYFNS